MGVKKRRSLTFREIAILGSIIVAAIAAFGGWLAADIKLGSLIGGGGDFLSVWVGARAFVSGQPSPYSEEVAGLAQQLAYGRAANPGENPYRLTIPFFLLPFFFPLALTSYAAVARGIWLCLGQASVAASALVGAALLEWRPPRAFLLLVGGATVFGLYAVAAMFSGTPIIVLGLLYPTILWALQTGRDELAGSLLVLSCFTWEVGALFVILIIWRVLYEKRWGALAGFAMTLVILLATSFLLYPGWILPYLVATVSQIRSGFGVAMGPVLLHIWPQHGRQIAQAMAAVLSGLFIYEWWSGRNGDSRRFVWICLLALSVMPLLGLRTELSHLVVLGPCVVWICAASFQRARGGAGLALAAAAAIFVLPWLLAGRWLLLHDRAAYDYLFLFYPLVSMAGLYWTRWWILRPNRTWLDEVRAFRT